MTYVVASGLTYGAGENIFHFWFKSAWHGDTPSLQVFGDGQNMIPTIHILDLASVVVNIADGRPKARYILAVDDSKNMLEEIVKAISQNLGTGKIQHVSKEDALLNKDLSQCHYDHLLVNLQMEATCAKDSMHINWRTEVHSRSTFGLELDTHQLANSSLVPSLISSYHVQDRAWVRG